MLHIKQFVFNPFGENTYLVWDPGNLDAIVVDPGMTDSAERKLFDNFIDSNKLKINQIVNTHMHLDHCFGNNYVRNSRGVKVAANTADASLGREVDSQARMFGIGLNESFNTEIDVPLSDGDTVQVGAYTLEVIALPGHSEGGIALYSADGKFALVGDSIFYGSVGRTDLPGASHSELIRSLQRRILTLPDDTLLLPGHDRSTTVAQERRHNPYLIEP